jgi:hypothetical protein
MSNLTRLADNFQAIANFLEGTTPMNPKPYLFCQSTWLQKQTMNDVWLNPSGHQEAKFDDNGQLSLYKNRDVQYMVDKRGEASDAGLSSPFPVSILCRFSP